jgi:hypothetical protein
MTDQDKMQSEGRKDNAARPDHQAAGTVTPEVYPPAGKDDAVERTGRTEAVVGEKRAFEATKPPATDEGRLGPGGDPAEGKR